MALIDTGGSVTTVGRPLYQKLQQVNVLRLQKGHIPRLEGVDGYPIPTLGCAEVEAEIGAGVYMTPIIFGQRQKRETQLCN